MVSPAWAREGAGVLRAPAPLVTRPGLGVRSSPWSVLRCRCQFGAFLTREPFLGPLLGGETMPLGCGTRKPGSRGRTPKRSPPGPGSAEVSTAGERAPVGRMAGGHAGLSARAWGCRADWKVSMGLSPHPSVSAEFCPGRWQCHPHGNPPWEPREGRVLGCWL